MQQADLLSPTASACERTGMLDELGRIDDADHLTRWAGQALTRKNKLTTADAQDIEAAFIRRLTELTSAVPGDHPDSTPTVGSPAPHEPPSTGAAPGNDSPSDSGEHCNSAIRSPRTRKGRELSGTRADKSSIDKSVLAFPEPRRIRDKEHLRFVARQPCLVCGRTPSDAHHLRFAQLRALGRKVSDEYAVPLCRGHHRQLHQAGNELLFWETRGINALELAKTLWEQSRSGLAETGNITHPSLSGF